MLSYKQYTETFGIIFNTFCISKVKIIEDSSEAGQN